MSYDMLNTVILFGLATFTFIPFSIYIISMICRSKGISKSKPEPIPNEVERESDKLKLKIIKNLSEFTDIVFHLGKQRIQYELFKHAVQNNQTQCDTTQDDTTQDEEFDKVEDEDMEYKDDEEECKGDEEPKGEEKNKSGDKKKSVEEVFKRYGEMAKAIGGLDKGAFKFVGKDGKDIKFETMGDVIKNMMGTGYDMMKELSKKMEQI